MIIVQPVPVYQVNDDDDERYDDDKKGRHAKPYYFFILDFDVSCTHRVPNESFTKSRLFAKISKNKFSCPVLTLLKWPPLLSSSHDLHGSDCF